MRLSPWEWMRELEVQECVGSFFFSSRRRHTRFDCDWSSDVCSSDLDVGSDIALANAVAREIIAAGLENREFIDRADRKSTRLNSSHSQISYAVFCLKKKKTPKTGQSYTSPTHITNMILLSLPQRAQR